MTSLNNEPSNASSGRRFAPRTVEQQRRRPLFHWTPTQPKAVSEFQPDAVEVEERSPPRLARITLYCVVALVAAAVTWASLSYVDVIVTAPGKLITTRPNVVVQPLETSIIRDIHVKVGEAVERGQPLATLDPTFSQADVDQLRTRVSALDAAIDRLNAEMNGSHLGNPNPDNADELIQHRLYSERKAFYDSSLRNYDAQVASAQANLKTSIGEEELLLKRLDTLKEIEQIRGVLTDQKLGSKLLFLQSRDARLDVENNLSRVRGSEIDYSHRLDKAQAERQVFIDDFRRNAYQELVETRAKRNSAMEELRKAELRRKLVVLTAPVDAVVLEIASRSVGSVAREAETLFSLVPRDVPLQAEVNIDGKDIGRVAVGQSVRLKFDAFPFQKHGTGSGVVRVVSQDSFNPETKSDRPAPSASLHYRVLIDVSDAHLRDLPDAFQMMPGMTLTAELSAGNRSVISYFLYPVLRGLDESIREP